MNYKNYLISCPAKLDHLIEVIKTNSLWRTFGDEAKDELVKEGYNKQNSLFAKESSDEEFLYETIVFNSILFFDLEVRAGLKNNEEDHMWLHYYRSFVYIVCKNIEDLDASYDKIVDTYYIDVLDEIFKNMIDWIRLSNREKRTCLINDIATCFGACIYEMVKHISLCNVLANESKLDDKYVVEKLDDLLETYNSFVDNETTPLIRDELDRILLHPIQPIVRWSKKAGHETILNLCTDEKKKQYNGYDSKAAL